MKALHTGVRKRRKGHRRKGILWEYNGDGRYFKEHLNSKEKRYWRKWRLREEKRFEEDNTVM